VSRDGSVENAQGQADGDVDEDEDIVAAAVKTVDEIIAAKEKDIMTV
jgi:ribosome recycling factor